MQYSRPEARRKLSSPTVGKIPSACGPCSQMNTKVVPEGDTRINPPLDRFSKLEFINSRKSGGAKNGGVEAIWPRALRKRIVSSTHPLGRGVSEVRGGVFSCVAHGMHMHACVDVCTHA